MTSQDIVNRAINLADLKNSQFIEIEDKRNSLNESFKDIYNKMTMSDDDFFVREVPLTITSAMRGVGPYEYFVPLPDDFYQLRYADYLGPQGWSPMKKWNLGTKDDLLVEPEYRFRGDTLWVLMGTSGTGIPLSIRIGYYTPVPDITLAGDIYTYLSNLTPAQSNLVSTPFYISYPNGAAGSATHSALYVYNSNSIVVDSLALHTQTTIFADTGALISNLIYYKGYLYYLRSGMIFKASLDLTQPTPATITPTAIITTGNLANFSINDNLIYGSTVSAGGHTWSWNTDGTGQSSISSVAIDDISFLGQLGNRKRCYILRSTSHIWIGDSVDTGIVASHLVSDNVYLYYVGTYKNVHRLTVTNLDTLPTVVKDDTLFYDVNYLGNADIPPEISSDDVRLSLIAEEDLDLHVISAVINYDFSTINGAYNIIPEIMSYRAAIDFKMKQGADPGQLQLRLSELYKRFENVVKRDEYKIERVQNYYKSFNSGIYS